MSLLPRCMALIRFHEGTEYKAYKDTKGLWTWGVGWCLDTRPATTEERAVILGITNEKSAPWENPYSLAMWLSNLQDHHKIIIAGLMLRSEIESLLPQLETQLGYWSDLGDDRAAAMVDLAFNLGLSGLLAFKKTHAFLAQGKWSDAAHELLDSQYAKDVGARAVRIAIMLKTGEWPSEVEKPYDA